MIHIRSATEFDIPFITAIYNEAVLNTTATFDTELKTTEDRLIWLRNHSASFPVIVAEENGMVIGWASLSKWSERSAYDSTAELSVYVDKEHRDKGVGKQLMELITYEGKEAGLHTLISRITEGNEKSIYLHERLGFKNIGTLKEVGKKFGKFLDVHMLQIVFEG
jgi:phosphinothricin acetyltransferase